MFKTLGYIMFPDPKPPLGEPPAEAELAAFIRSARAQGLGHRRILHQVALRFRPRARSWHSSTIKRILSRIDAENVVRCWLETEAGRAELAAMAHELVRNAAPHAGLGPLTGSVARLGMIERLSRAARGEATPAELDCLARHIATAHRRPGRRRGQKS
jgi:hypothetical protein